jgi:hypothetical protein
MHIYFALLLHCIYFALLLYCIYFALSKKAALQGGIRIRAALSG